LQLRRLTESTCRVGGHGWGTTGGQRIQLSSAGIPAAPPRQLTQHAAPFGDEIGVGSQPGSALLLLAKPTRLLPRLVR
jgi:hypothetical protein